MPTVMRESDYSTKYTFTIKAAFRDYPSQITFTYSGPVEFMIRDYCVGMQISNILGVTAQDSNVDVTMASSKEPWIVQISKHLFSGQSSFIMRKLTYQPYQPVSSSVKTQCGNLAYTFTKYSWDKKWSGDNIIAKAPGSAYQTPTGYSYIVEATKRASEGKHQVEMEVASDLGIITVKKIVNF